MKNQSKSGEEPIGEKKKMDDLLRRMLSTPPKPHKKPDQPKKKTAK